RRPPSSPLFPYTTLFRSNTVDGMGNPVRLHTLSGASKASLEDLGTFELMTLLGSIFLDAAIVRIDNLVDDGRYLKDAALLDLLRSEEHMSELQSRENLVC